MKKKENTCTQKKDNTRTLRLVLLGLIIALIAVIAYILWQEAQYSVSDEFYDSLRNTGLMKGGLHA